MQEARGSFSRLLRCCVRTLCVLFLAGSDPTLPLRLYSNADCLLYTPNKLCWSMIFSPWHVTITLNASRVVLSPGSFGAVFGPAVCYFSQAAIRLFHCDCTAMLIVS